MAIFIPNLYIRLRHEDKYNCTYKFRFSRSHCINKILTDPNISPIISFLDIAFHIAVVNLFKNIKIVSLILTNIVTVVE